MAQYSMMVSCSAREAAALVERHVVGGSFSGSVIDRHVVEIGGGRSVTVLVFEKYFMRVSNRLTLTVTIDDAAGATRVHSVGGGGGESALFRFDWGAAASFENAPADALRRYVIG